MAPEVLYRVCHGNSNPGISAVSNLQMRPAILHNHRRHRVRHADYPAVIPHASSTVRGTYVTGLTDADIWRLDIFEGEEYERKTVRPRLLTKVGDESGKGNVEGQEVPAETYIWIAGEHELEQEEWDFAEFQREKMRYWVGEQATHEYAEVDDAVRVQENDGTRGRGLNGHISSALQEVHAKDKARKGEEPLQSAV